MKVPAVATIVFPDHMHLDLQTPDGPFTIVATPEAGFTLAAGRSAHDMPESRNRESLGKSSGMPSTSPSMLTIRPLSSPPEPAKDRGCGYEIVDVSGPGVSIRWYVDPATSHIVREAYQTAGPQGSAQGTTDLSHWQTTDGITLPTLHTIN